MVRELWRSDVPSSGASQSQPRGGCAFRLTRYLRLKVPSYLSDSVSRGKGCLSAAWTSQELLICFNTHDTERSILPEPANKASGIHSNTGQDVFPTIVQHQSAPLRATGVGLSHGQQHVKAPRHCLTSVQPDTQEYQHSHSFYFPLMKLEIGL